MSGKSVTISARIAEEDAEFLALLDLPGASTPSEKIRALIAQARSRHSEGRTYEASLTLLRDLLEPSAQALRAREMATRQRSELLADALYWLPDLVALLVSGPPNKARPGDLLEFEAAVAQRVFHFIEAMLRLAVTSKAPCYNPDVMSAGLSGTLELAQLILANRLSRRE